MYGSWDSSTRWVAYDLGQWLTISREDLAGGSLESYDYRVEWGTDAETVLGALGYLVPYGWEPAYGYTDGTRRYATVERV